MKTLTDLNLINFSDCPVHNMTISLPGKELQVVFDYLYINTNKQWEAVDQLALTISNWQELIVDLFQDNVWKTLDLDRPETFKEIHEIVYQENGLIVEGFSAQSGYWLRYTFKGYSIHIAVNTYTTVKS
ncbi:hypothetical protein [Fibrella aquatilis]|uniref:Uncharacterized protein n=1 Tax=Fibrella aquatilis TaxID=2817059 RepID=A0A939G7Z7_9BACT|nr:hypothetical protein [Fibrella aquatilis]MBO0931731.1 hypothetical protein [Fibrella aquatilis]